MILCDHIYIYQKCKYFCVKIQLTMELFMLHNVLKMYHTYKNNLIGNYGKFVEKEIHDHSTIISEEVNGTFLKIQQYIFSSRRCC